MDLITEAQDPKTPSERLLEISRYTLRFTNGKSEVLAAIASNPNAPPSLLRGLAPEYPSEVMGNPLFPLLTIEEPGFWQGWQDKQILHFVRCNLQALVKEHQPLFFTLMGDYKSVQLFFYETAYKSFPREVVIPFLHAVPINEQSLVPMRLVSINPYTPPSLIQRLAEFGLSRDSFSWLLGNLATHPNTSPELLARLLREGNQWVQSCLQARQDYLAAGVIMNGQK